MLEAFTPIGGAEFQMCGVFAAAKGSTSSYETDRRRIPPPTPGGQFVCRPKWDEGGYGHC